MNSSYSKKYSTKKAFTLVEVLIALGLVLFASVSLIEIFGNGVKNIDRLSSRYESRYLHTFLTSADSLVAGGASSDFYKYVSSRYSIDNNRVYDYLNGVTYTKQEDELKTSLRDRLNNDLLRCYKNSVEINNTTVDVIKLRDLTK